MDFRLCNTTFINHFNNNFVLVKVGAKAFVNALVMTPAIPANDSYVAM